MEVKLNLKRDAQGWQSEHDGKLVVASRWLCYSLDQIHGTSVDKVSLPVKLEEMLGFFVAH